MNIIYHICQWMPLNPTNWTFNKMPLKTSFCPETPACTNPTCCPTYQTESTHTLFQGNRLFQWHWFSIAAEKAQLYLQDNPSASPLCKSNVRWHHIHRGAAGDEATSTGIITFSITDQNDMLQCATTRQPKQKACRTVVSFFCYRGE